MGRPTSALKNASLFTSEASPELLGPTCLEDAAPARRVLTLPHFRNRWRLSSLGIHLSWTPYSTSGPVLPPSFLSNMPGLFPWEHLAHSANKYLPGANYVPGPVWDTDQSQSPTCRQGSLTYFYKLCLTTREAVYGQSLWLLHLS